MFIKPQEEVDAKAQISKWADQAMYKATPLTEEDKPLEPMIDGESE